MIDDLHIPLPTDLLEHRRAITTLADAGIKPPTAWVKLNQRLDDYLSLKSPALDNLIGSVLRPAASNDRPQMRAWSISEAACSHQNLAQVNGAVISAVLGKLREIYAATTQDVYQQASTLFDETASSFHACCEVCDPELPAESVVGRSEVEQGSWMAAARHAGRLTTLLAPLAVAASLAGVEGLDIDAPDDAALIALTVDTDGVHRRRLWECWLKDGGGRCGRWSALAALGATIRAVPDLTGFTPYRECRPLIHQQVQIAKGQYVNRTTDPEDNPGALPPIDVHKQPANVVFAR